jgi:hypothetical protein
MSWEDSSDYVSKKLKQESHDLNQATFKINLLTLKKNEALYLTSLLRILMYYQTHDCFLSKSFPISFLMLYCTRSR